MEDIIIASKNGIGDQLCTPVLSHSMMELKEPTAKTSPDGHHANDVMV
jgi:hypothetical protein